MATRVPAVGGPCSSLPSRPKQLEQLARDQGTAVRGTGLWARREEGAPELRQVDTHREKHLAPMPRAQTRGQTGVLLTRFEAGDLRSRTCRLAGTIFLLRPSPSLSPRARGLATPVKGLRAPLSVSAMRLCPAEPGTWPGPQKGQGLPKATQ